jgi:serine O-acetyltransferase
MHDEKGASKLFYLNKVLHGINCLYDANLPKIFLFIHSIGTVLGKACYSDYLIVSQGCTVGAHNNIYPTLKKGVALLPHASIIGECTIGERVSIGINASIYSKDVKSDKIVYQSNENGLITVKSSKTFWGQKFFYEQL